MIAFKQNSIRHSKSIDFDFGAISDPVKSEAEQSEDGSILLIDSRALDGQCLANSISASINAIWCSSMAEWNKTKVRRRPKAILINISGKVITDPAVAAEIKAVTSASEVPTIVMSDSEDLFHIMKALELGARGYIPSSVNLDICIKAILLAVAGGVFLPASSVLAMRQNLLREPNVTRPLSEMFTGRQAQIIEALRRGKANKIIAHELGMQESTVKVHIRTIMKKVKATNRTEVVYRINELFPPGLSA